MIIRNVKFLKSATEPDKTINSSSEFALVGRSNVGKSSLINFLVNSKTAKESSSPGRTRLLNYFEINNGEFLLVDLPGYGYSKAGKEQTNNWDQMMSCYFTNNERLKHVLMLVDSRIEPTEKDIQMMNYLVFNNISFSIVMTKCDKLSKNELKIAKQKIATKLKVGIDNIYAVSSLKKVGKEEILTRLEQFI